jgi:transcriptional regulator with XRE-family HTH domain
MGTNRARKWKDIKNDTMSQKQQDAAEAEARAMYDALPLAEIRKAREYTQAQLADELELPQGSVSKIENRTDLYLSTLRRYIEALGGELCIVAKFPNADILIEGFALEAKTMANSAQLQEQKKRQQHQLQHA